MFLRFFSFLLLSIQGNCYHHPKIPQDVMVDVVNNLALKLLAIHNEGNDNNIAISPYGALSVLVALGEGLQGEALYEIERCANIPSDPSVIRIGLRDIHRHLKSYFIPEEGFLSGLTLNHDNVTLKRDYEDILKFYGFDIGSFNSALYPDLFGTSTLAPTEISTNTEMVTETTAATTETTSATTTTTEEVPSTTTVIPQEVEIITTTPKEIETTTTVVPKEVEIITTTPKEIETTTTVIHKEVEIIPTTTKEIETTTSLEQIEVFTTTMATTTTQGGEDLDDLVEMISDLPDNTESSSQSTSTSGDTTENIDETTIINTTPTIEDATKQNKILKRQSRSIVDYMMARYYDDHPITEKPVDPTNHYFLINGKYKETNINYMTYDTILPFHYLPHLHTLALRFPLDSSKYYLLLLLPENPDDIDKLICDLRLNTDLKYIVENLRYTHVNALIPSFMLKGIVVLTSTFQKIGIRRVFEPRNADFSPMTNEKDIYVTNIEQAITVNIRNYVDPVTMNSNKFLQQNDPVYFKADHPFLYFVIDSDIGVTLMEGKIVNPLNTRIR